MLRTGQTCCNDKLDLQFPGHSIHFASYKVNANVNLIPKRFAEVIRGGCVYET